MARQRDRVNYTARTGNKKRVINGALLVNVSQSGSFQHEDAHCVDDLGRHIPHNLSIWKSYRNINPLNGFQQVNATSWRQYSGWYEDSDIGWVPGHSSALDPASDGSLAAKAMARTNPGRAHVSLPTFVGELKDLPRLVRSVGHLALLASGKAGRRSRAIVQEAGHANLTWQFGIAPIISDIKKIVSFQKQVERRCSELDRLYSKGGLRRRIQLQNDSNSVTSSDLAFESSLGSVLSLRPVTSSRTRVWATVRWRPTTLPKFRNDKQKRDLANRLVFGLNAHTLGVTAWELIPWSWLGDWFFDVQSFLEAHNNAVPASSQNVCVMKHRRTETVYTRVDSQTWVSGGDGSSSYETKTRVVGASPSINTSLPLLSGKQLSILGSLAVTRVKGLR